MESTRRLLLLGATSTPLGIVVALLGDATIGGLIVIVGLGAAGLGLHRFGRSGAA